MQTNRLKNNFDRQQILVIHVVRYDQKTFLCILFFTATNDNQHTDLQPVYVQDSVVEHPELGEQEEQNDEEMDVNGPDDDDDAFGCIAALATHEE